MRKALLRMLPRLLVFVLPYTLLAVLGVVWIVQNRAAIPYAIGVAVVSTVAWLTIRWWERRPLPAVSAVPEPPPTDTWPDAGKQAWASVDAIANRVQQSPPPYDDLAAWQAIGLEVFQAAARPFRGNSKYAAVSITVPEALKLGELIVRDMRVYIEENVPLVDKFKLDMIASVLDMKERYAGGTSWGTLFHYSGWASKVGYWGIRAAINPTTAVVGGIQQATVGSSTTNLLEPVMGMVAAKFVRITGRYAIDLYSGQLNLNENVKALAQSKPLQILVLGQTKAGKSSLINAVFGKPRAATDVLPCAASITPYIIEKPGLPSIHLYDSIGFGGSDDKEALRLLKGKLSDCDLILVVCSAASAAREPDRRMLDSARHQLSTQKTRGLPPILVALTHIDTVRPINEWKPPYDFARGQGTKETNARAACEIVAADLQVPPGDVIPVCAHPQRTCNIDEGLLARIVAILPEADRAKLLRVLEGSASAEAWERRKQQLMTVVPNLLSLGATGATLFGWSKLDTGGKLVANQTLNIAGKIFESLQGNAKDDPKD